MGDERARPVLTPFEEVAGALQAAERAPTLLAVDADSVLWPCSWWVGHRAVLDLREET